MGFYALGCFITGLIIIMVKFNFCDLLIILIRLCKVNIRSLWRLIRINIKYYHFAFQIIIKDLL